ncbi:hypothetical protein ACTXT7_014736, partial [Hymenolepis weldensis]
IKQQSVQKSCLLDHQASQTCQLLGHKEGCHTPASSRTSKSSTMIRFTKCLGRCIHIRAKSKLVFRLKRSALMDAKCKEPEEIVLVKPVSRGNGTVSKVVAQNAGRTAFPNYQDLICSRSDVF